MLYRITPLMKETQAIGANRWQFRGETGHRTQLCPLRTSSANVGPCEAAGDAVKDTPRKWGLTNETGGNTVRKKKLLGSTVALAMLFTYSQASAEILKNFKLGGQIDVQATSAHNVTDFATRPVPPALPVPPAPGVVGKAVNDRIGDAQTRILLHADWDLLDDVHAKVTLRKNDRTYGHVGGALGTAAGPATASQPLQANAAGNVLGNIFLDQASFKIDKVADMVDLTLGRQFYGNSGDMVVYFGPSDKALYGLYTTAIDAARFDWSNDMVGVTGLVGKITGSALGIQVPAAVVNVDLHGLAASLKGNEMWNGGAYVWRRVTHNQGGAGAPPLNGTAGGKNDFLWVLGVKGKVMMGPGWAALELAKNYGENRVAGVGGIPGGTNYEGWAAKLDVGAKLEMGVAAVSPWAHYGVGSGDARPSDNKTSQFVAISPDYRPGAIYGRFAVPTDGVAGQISTSFGAYAGGAYATNSLSNRTVYGFGVKANPAAVNKLTTGLAFWHLNFTAEPETFLADGNKHIGAEIDWETTWQHSENVSLTVTLGQFMPGGAIAARTQSSRGNPAVLGNPSANSERGLNPAKMAAFDVRVKF